MNRHRHILVLLVSLFALIDSSPSHKTDDGASTPSSSNSFHPRHSIRRLGSNIADLNDEPYSSDNSPGQMPLSTPTSTSITDDDIDTDEGNAPESLANLSNDRLIIVSNIYGSDPNNEDEERDRSDVLVTNELYDEPVDLAPFFGVTDAKAFRVFSYSYDTMPPTISAQTRLPVPTPDTSTSISITSTESEEPTDDPSFELMFTANDDLHVLIMNGSMESQPLVPTPAPFPP